MVLRFLICTLLVPFLWACSSGPAPITPPVDPNAIQVGSPPKSGKAWEDEVFRLTNIARTKRGLPALMRDATLDQIARAQAKHMASIRALSHAGPNGERITTRADQAGYPYRRISENVFGPIGNVVDFNRLQPLNAVQDWLESPAHKKNMLGTTTNEIGVGYHQGFAVQVFGKKG